MGYFVIYQRHTLDSFLFSRFVSRTLMPEGSFCFSEFLDHVLTFFLILQHLLPTAFVSSYIYVTTNPEEKIAVNYKICTMIWNLKETLSRQFFSADETISSFPRVAPSHSVGSVGRRSTIHYNVDNVLSFRNMMRTLE